MTTPQFAPSSPLAGQPVPFAPPPPGYSPPPPAYGAPPPPPAHKLNGTVIALIAAAVVLVAGGVTAVVVLTGGSSSHSAPSAPQGLGPGALVGPKPAATVPVQPVASQPASAPASPPAAPQQTAPASQPAAPQGGQPAAGGAVVLAGGLSITPVSGWTANSKQPGSVELDNAAGNAVLFVYSGGTTTSDTTSEFQSEVQNWVQQNGVTNVQLGQVGQPSQLSGPNLTRELAVGFHGVISTQQGTLSLDGVFDLRMDTAGSLEAFAVLTADSKASLQSAVAATDQMLTSMG